MTYKMKDLQDIGLVQWNKIGDHPDVSAFSDPKYTLGNQCKICGKSYKTHGLIKNPANKPATGYDHFHGKNDTTVCPGDFIFQTSNDNGVKQTVVIPEKMHKNITHAIRDSYKETIIDKAITEVIYREYYCRDFSFNSDIVKILNTDWTQVSDNLKLTTENYTHKTFEHKWDTVNFTGVSTELYDLTTKTHKVMSKDYSHKSISYHGNFKFQRERTLNRHIQSDRYLNIDSFDIHFVQRQSRRCGYDPECNLIIDGGAIVDLPDCRNCTYLNDAGDILDLRTCAEQAGVLGANGLPVLQEFHLWEWHGTTNSTLNSYGEKITNLENKSSASVDKVKDLEDRVKTLEDTIIDLTGRIVALGG